ncbi:hypothetical protein CU012_1229 [Enterococcus faecium]|nr:hypothetical protein [Enterococcus faecium]
MLELIYFLNPNILDKKLDSFYRLFYKENVHLLQVPNLKFFDFLNP